MDFNAIWFRIKTKYQQEQKMSYDILFSRALKLHEDGQLDEAERIYRQILETAPQQPEVLNLLGLTAQAKGAQSEACSLFYRALQAAPERADFYYNMAFSLRLDGKPLEALENFRKVVSLRPDVKEAYNEIALILEKEGRLSEARENWQKALQIDAAYSEAAANLAMSYRNENCGLAAKMLEEAAEQFSGEARIWYYLSQLYMEAGDCGKAWKAAIRAKELAPASDEVRTVLGQLSLKEGKVDSARIYFDKALLLNNKNTAALAGAALAAAEQKDFDAAEQKYKRLLALDSKNFEAHNNYAALLHAQKRTAEALEEYRQAVILNPRSAEVSNNLGVILKDTGDYEEAMGLFLNALSINPALEDASVNLSETLVLYQHQEPDKALKIAENWVKNMPDNVFARQAAAAFKGEKIEDTQGYSERLFDNFADNYELVVQNIGYTVPLALGRIAGSVEGSVVDLGCGTGLCGEVIKSLGNNQLTGVDISQRMLDKAAEKNIYQQLVRADAVDYLRQHPGFDWVAAADVLGYIGNPEALFEAAAGSALLFSSEDAGSGCADYELAASGRYRHNPQFIEALLRKHGYSAVYREKTILRQENGEPVPGSVWKAE